MRIAAWHEKTRTAETYNHLFTHGHSAWTLPEGRGYRRPGEERGDDLQVLEARKREVGVDPAGYGWYLELCRVDAAPKAGFGPGFEGLVQFATGIKATRDCFPVSRTPGVVALGIRGREPTVVCALP